MKNSALLSMRLLRRAGEWVCVVCVCVCVRGDNREPGASCFHSLLEKKCCFSVSHPSCRARFLVYSVAVAVAASSLNNFPPLSPLPIPFAPSVYPRRMVPPPPQQRPPRGRGLDLKQVAEPKPELELGQPPDYWRRLKALVGTVLHISSPPTVLARR